MILLVNLAFSSGLDLNGKSKHWAIEINNLRTKRRSKFERWDTTDLSSCITHGCWTQHSRASSRAHHAPHS